MIIYKLRKNTLNLIMSDILKLYIIYFMIMRYSSVINIGRYYHFPNTRHSRLKNTFEIFALSDLSISTFCSQYWRTTVRTRNQYKTNKKWLKHRVFYETYLCFFWKIDKNVIIGDKMKISTDFKKFTTNSLQENQQLTSFFHLCDSLLFTTYN